VCWRWYGELRSAAGTMAAYHTWPMLSAYCGLQLVPWQHITRGLCWVLIAVCSWYHFSTPCQCYFLNNSVKHWRILINFGTQHHEKNWRKWLTLVLLLHYLVKSRSRSLAVYNNEFVLVSACVSSESHCESTKSLKIVTCLTLIVSTLRSCCQTYIQCVVAHCLELFPQSHIRQCLKASRQVLCTSNISAEIL